MTDSNTTPAAKADELELSDAQWWMLQELAEPNQNADGTWYLPGRYYRSGEVLRKLGLVELTHDGQSYGRSGWRLTDAGRAALTSRTERTGGDGGCNGTMVLGKCHQPQQPDTPLLCSIADELESLGMSSAAESVRAVAAELSELRATVARVEKEASEAATEVPMSDDAIGKAFATGVHSCARHLLRTLSTATAETKGPNDD